ncbi:LamG-like jellyroll fold domain-containing protein [Sinosporangium siamense]
MAVKPDDEALISSLTPTLRADSPPTGHWSTTFAFKFTVCDNQSMTGSSCVSSNFDEPFWTVPAGHLKWAKEYWWTATVRESIDGLTNTTAKRSFTTGVRQPTITSKLSARGANGQEFHPLAGNYTTSFTDAVVNTVGPPLSVVRSYNSMDPRRTGMFGAGWSTRWDMHIRQQTLAGQPTLLVTYPDGREVRFADNGDGTFQPPPGMHATLGTVTGGGWRLTDKSSTTIYHFDAQGRLSSATDRRGRSQTLTYDGNGKLVTVIGAGGRSLTFNWTGGQVTSVATNPVEGSPLTWTYEYTQGRLTKVCSPAAAPNCTLYDYGVGSTYRTTVLNEDPTGYWRLNETTGATASNLGSEGGTGDYWTGPISVAGALEGTPDTAVDMSDETIILPKGVLHRREKQISLELWFKTTASGVVVAPGGDGDFSGTQQGSALYVGLDGKLRGSWNESATPITSAAPVNNGQWHHAVLTGAASDQKLYLDGALVGSLNAPVEIPDDFVTLGYGMALPGHSPSVPGTSGTRTAFPFTGHLDEVAVYDRPLSLAEVQQHYDARLAVPHLMTKITLPSGRTWAENTYDPATDRVKTHTDQHGGVWQVGVPAYTAATGRSTVIVKDPRNKNLTYEYDAWRGNRLIREIDQLGRATGYAYDTGGFISRITDRNGLQTRQTFDKRGNLLTKLDCDPAVTGSCQAIPHRYTYHLNATDEFDPRNDQVITHRDPRSTSATDNTYATTWEYNQYGEQIKQTFPATSDFPNGRSSTTTYTDGTEPAEGGGQTLAGLVKTNTDPKGNAVSYKYTSAGDLAEETTATGLILRHEYDTLGRATAKTEVSQANPTGVRTTYTYSPLGQLLTQTAPGVLNEVSRVTHTAETRHTYNPDGLTLTTSVVDLTGGNPERKITYTYDPRGRLETETDPEGGVVSHTWDTTGAHTSSTDQLGNKTVFAYTFRGELASKTLKNWTGSPVAPQAPADLVLESYAYDFGGRLASTTNAVGRITAKTYFPDDKVATVKAVNARTNAATTGRDIPLEANTYDAAGNLIMQVTGNGRTTTNYVYDAANRLTTKTVDPNGLARATSFTYDANGNVTRETKSAAGTSRTESVEYAYSPGDQQTRQTVENGAQDLETTWTRDDRGLVTAMTSPRGNLPGATGFKTEYTYDKVGRLVADTAPEVQVERHGAASASRPVTMHGYDNAGSKTHVVDAEGRTSTTNYDRLGRTTSTVGATYFAPLGNAPAPLTGAVAHWKIDEGTGTALADTIGSRTATLSGSTAWVPGRAGSGVQFGSNTHAVTAAPVLTTNASYTVSAWVRLTHGDLNATVSQDGATRSAFQLAYSAADGKWRLATYDTDSATAVEKSAVSNRRAKLNDWTHLVGVYDAATGHIRLYENGEQVASNAVTATFNAAGGFLIGSSKQNGAYEHSFRGDLDEVQAYGRALTDQEIRSLSGITPKVSYLYDAAGRETKRTDARGSSWTTEYDALGNRVRITEPGPNGQPGGQRVSEYNTLGEQTGAVDPTGARTGATYDDLGRMVTSTSVEREPTLSTLVTRFEYNDAGNKTKEIRPGSRTTLYQVNAVGEVTSETNPLSNATQFVYDLVGRSTKVTNPLGNATVTEYDLAGRKTAVKDLNSTGAVLRETSTSYDADGNPVAETSAEGHMVDRTFDALGRMTQLVEPVTATQSITTTFGYDTAGNRTRTTDGRGNVIWTAYNSLGMVETVTEPATTAYPNLADRTWTSVYDAGGNAVTTAAPGGVRIDRTFDHLGNLTRQTGTGAETATAERTFGYDLAGRPTSIGDFAIDYNDRGLMTRVLKGATQQGAYSYDGVGNLLQRVDAAGTANFTWDTADRLATATDPVVNRTLTYGYDTANQMTSVTATGQASQQTFAYDDMGRRTSHTVKRGNGVQLAKITYGWDKDDNLTSKTTVSLAGAGANTYAYDKAGRLTSWTDPANTTTAYEWDAAGNRTKAGNTVFTYDERNRLTSGGGTDYTYTPRGTVNGETTNGTTKNLVFDAFDQLTSDGTTTYAYDALNRVSSRTEGGSVQHFTYSGLANDLAAVTDAGGAVQAKYSRDSAGQLLGLQEGGGAAVAAANDLRGDLVATFSSTAVVDSFAYNPFGEVVAESGTRKNIGYQGEYTDPASGKVNMAARWYRPGTGGFVSRDTMTLDPAPSVQANRYTYANASPLTNVDPTGNYALEVVNSSYTSPPGSQSSPKPTSCQYCMNWGKEWEVDTGGMPPWWYMNNDLQYVNHHDAEAVRWNPIMSDEEARAAGVMPNGRESEIDGYWKLDKNARELHLGLYESGMFASIKTPICVKQRRATCKDYPFLIIC